MNPLAVNPLATAQQQAPQAGPPAASPEQIADARKHSAAVVNGLSSLTSKPQGELTKQDVFGAASDMIAKGAFSTPDSKQQLVQALTQLPNDEPSLRQALGTLLLQSSANLAKLHEIHGAGDA